MRKTIDIVLPCYNPLEDWAETVVSHFLDITRQIPHDIQLIIVNDGSSKPLLPEKIDLIRESVPQLKWIEQHPNKGKGAALRRGMTESNAEISVFTDVDFPYTTDSTVRLIHSLLDQKGDIVVGQRRKNYYEKTPWQRKMISQMLKWFNKNVLRIPVTDTQVGLKGFNAAGRSAFLRTTVNRYLFDLEFLILASRRGEGLTIAPVEVELRDNVVFTKLSLKTLMPELRSIVPLFFRAWRR